MNTGWIYREAFEKVRDIDPKAQIVAVGRRSLKVSYTAEAVNDYVIGRG